MNSRISRNERGIAMLVVLFSVLLLSVIGLGMMYSTNMESSINSNYRDKQSAFYAALAGLQEARDRIQPATHNIVAPGQLPSVAAANVIYIVSNYSTVKPWLTSSPYFDTELCQEKVLNIPVGIPGVPCTSIASGSTWFSYVDDSQSSSAPWNLTYPLDLKWVRIQLKANNNTPVAVNGDPSSSDQTCWTGVSQMSTPTGYSTGCHPVGGVTAVMMASSGMGYTSAPTVVFGGGGGGSGATATAVLAPEQTGYISAITLTTGGSGYTTAPTVTISGSVGSGATATAVLSSTGVLETDLGVVNAVVLTTGGTYTSAPAVTLDGGGGVGATAVAVLGTSGTVTTTGYVDSIATWTGGTGYTSAPTISFSGGSGSGAAATATLGTTGIVKTVTLSSVGTQCYSQASDAVITFTGGGGTGAAATAVLDTTRSCIYSVTIPSPTPKCSSKLTGADHQDNVSFASGNQSGYGTLYVAADQKSPIGYTVVNPGDGYTTSPIGPTNLQLASGSWAGGGDCSNLQGTITTGYHIASINLTNGGSGYTSDPTVTISGGVGSTSQPTATVTRGFPISAITLTDGGSGYTSTPTMTISGGGGSGATATAHITTMSTTVYPVVSVTVTAGGRGYLSPPTVTFSSGGGSGALANAIVGPATRTVYPVASVTVNTGGMDYNPTYPPTITFSGGGGSGAAGIPVISTMNSGTYYVDHIDVNTSGSGYTTNPTVTLTGGGGSGATAVAQVSGGTKFGQVWLLTSLEQTRTGARSMLQMEVASPVTGYSPGGALTLDGPNPVMDSVPNSDEFVVSGYDANSCAGTAEPAHPAIDGYDDPNAPTPTNSVETIIDALPRPDHYVGSGGTPSVENGYASLGETMTTPTGLDGLMSAIYNTTGAVHYTTATANSFDPTSTNIHSITYVDGDLTLNGNATGYGILVVTGHLTMSGNFTWNGLVFVVGDGNMDFSGGGTGQINGQLFVAKIWDGYMTKNLLSTMGSPSFHWNGGGNNGVHYDHCLSTDLMAAVPYTAPPTTKPLKILSLRVLPY